MSQRLVLLALCSIPLVAIACSGGPAGLTASGNVSVRGTTPSGPFDASFPFPAGVRLDGSAGLTAMCTVSRGTATDGRVVFGAVVDLIPSTESPLDSLTLMARSDLSTGTIDADVRGTNFTNASCAYTTVEANAAGVVHIRTAGDCTLSSASGATVLAASDLTLRGCTVVLE